MKYAKLPIEIIQSYIKEARIAILLESNLANKENRYSYLFTDPKSIISCKKLSQVPACLKQIDQQKRKDNYICGFLSYEAGYAFCEKFNVTHAFDFPLIWMGVFKKPLIFDHEKSSFSKNIKKPSSHDNDRYHISNQNLDISRNDYIKNIVKIKRFIETGDTYQVNYTTKYRFKLHGSAWGFYKTLRASQPVNYSAFIKSPQRHIISLSPELFFRQEKHDIYVRPMKGTIARGLNATLDRKNAAILKNDPKNQAENLMIVDLLRSDIGAISKTGSVNVESLFDIEKYPTLFQMTSSIRGTLKKTLTLPKLFAGLFPSGSVTGAPKIHTMELIRKLEKDSRKIYTGSIGFISPKQKSVFNVAIRTLLIKESDAEMGVGSGITYSSDADLEFAECKLKADFLKQPEFKLIETMRHERSNGIKLLPLHLKRLRKSAKFFDFLYSEKSALAALRKSLKTLPKKSIHKIRILLESSGKISIETSQLLETAPSAFNKVILSKKRTDSSKVFFYHKTTNRKLYTIEHRKAKARGYFDVIFMNKKNEITEGAISNIFLKKGRFFYTPPISCGVLPGVYREYFIESNPKKVKEKEITLADLKGADVIYCSNALRKMVKVQLEF